MESRAPFLEKMRLKDIAGGGCCNKTGCRLEGAAEAATIEEEVDGDAVPPI